MRNYAMLAVVLLCAIVLSSVSDSAAVYTHSQSYSGELTFHREIMISFTMKWWIPWQTALLSMTRNRKALSCKMNRELLYSIPSYPQRGITWPQWN